MIRSAVQSDTEAVRKLWEICFPDEGGFNDYFFAHIYQYFTFYRDKAEENKE